MDIAAGPGNSVIFSITVAVTSNFSGDLTNTATIAPPSGVIDSNLGNNSATDTNTQNSIADMAITKDDGTTIFTPPIYVIYTIIVTNNGPSDVTGAGVSDIAPAGTSITSWSAMVNGFASVSNTDGNGDLSETVSIVAGQGNSVVFALILQVPFGFADVLGNTASVAVPAGVTDPSTANNSATDSNNFFFVNILGLNDAPIANDDIGTTNKDTPITIAVSGILINDTDVDVELLSVGEAVTADVTLNDTEGDEVDETTVDLDASGISGANCTATDLDGDCIEVTVPDEGVWSVDEATGEVTFTPVDYLFGDPEPIAYNVEDHEGNITSATISVFYICSNVDVKVLLEGPYLPGGTMTTALNEHHLLPGQDKNLSPSLTVRIKATHTPFGHPYNQPPWNYSDNLGLQYGDASSPGAPAETIPYPEDVVDWVLVTVREGGTLPEHNVWRCAGWLRSNGTVTFPDDCGHLGIRPDGDYYIMIEHRNHIGILSPSFANMVDGTKILEWDFTNNNSYEPIFRNGQKEKEPGIWVLFVVNGEQINSIGVVNSSDHTVWKGSQNHPNYKFGDFNMNVISNSEDETIWKSNQNRSSCVTFH